MTEWYVSLLSQPSNSLLHPTRAMKIQHITILYLIRRRKPRDWRDIFSLDWAHIILPPCLKHKVGTQLIISDFLTTSDSRGKLRDRSIAYSSRSRWPIRKSTLPHSDHPPPFMDENLSTGGPILIPSCLQLNASVYKVKREDGHGDLSFSESPLSVPVSHLRYRLTM